MNLSLLLLPVFLFASDRCPDLSGRYMLQDEDGRVYLTITQRECDTVTLVRSSSYLGRPTSERHVLRIDGAPHQDQGWLGARGRQRIAAQFVSKGLEVVVRNEPGQPAMRLKELFQLLPSGDLVIRDFNWKTGAYPPVSRDPEMVFARRSNH